MILEYWCHGWPQILQDHETRQPEWALRPLASGACERASVASVASVALVATGSGAPG
jgi:hypothetical protein